MISLIVIVSIAVFILGYLIYGRFLSRKLELDDSNKTPAVELCDGNDFVPAKAPLLLGQHFSAIAAAGPIVGPVLAGIWFGWLPALLWILFGSIFIGGVHDFTSLVVSIRHKACSIGLVVKQYMSPTSHILFLTFVWFALVYVIIAFTDITAQTFKTISADTSFGPGVAVSSFLYLLLGLVLGVALYKFKLNLWVATAIFIPLVVVVLWLGTILPAGTVAALSAVSVKQWEIVLLVYCFIASLLPMWLLLQPRGYLGGWFLYITILTGFAGALFGGFPAQYPALNLDALKSIDTGKALFPIIFITVACGACSGFHGIVSSGTTSKQIYKESDTRIVGYGAMLLEAVVAILALATVMMLAKGDPLLKSDPNFIYASGLAKYMNLAGISFNFALAFALLAFSTFVYDTLDVCTRLARYILQELLGWDSKKGAAPATFLTLLLPLVFLMATKEKGYLVAWPIFGTSNQLLASLTLLTVSVWLFKKGKSMLYALIPMIFMLVVTLWSLVLQILPFIKNLAAIASGQAVKPDMIISGVVGIILFVLSVLLVMEAVKILTVRKTKEAA